MVLAWGSNDGLRWLAADEATRENFLLGYLGCRASYCAPSKQRPYRHPLRMMEVLDRYYAAGGERLSKPVRELIERLIPDSTMAFDPVPPDIQGEPCCGGDCYDGR